jgi:alkylation response protein AidB-like acyl-CoA dehydrogenase
VTTPLQQRLCELIDNGCDRLPQPGQGETMQRWQALAAVAAEDVALVKLFEGHTDALAIMAELDAPATGDGRIWATWAAEPPFARLELRHTVHGVELSGRKAWCSGADIATHAVVTAWDAENRQCLAAVALDQPGVRVTTDGWHAVGMGRATSGDVLFDSARASLVGAPGDYIGRPGFWHGACGIAACWYGGAVPLVEAVAELVGRRSDPHAAAHLGALDVAMSSVRALLIETATWIDEHPLHSAQQQALTVRGAAEYAASDVLSRAGRTLGAGPLCRDSAVANRVADLPVFIRQSHAERDLAELGALLAADPYSRLAGRRWSL